MNDTVTDKYLCNSKHEFINLTVEQCMPTKSEHEKMDFTCEVLSLFSSCYWEHMPIKVDEETVTKFYELMNRLISPHLQFVWWDRRQNLSLKVEFRFTQDYVKISSNSNRFTIRLSPPKTRNKAYKDTIWVVITQPSSTL